MRFLGDSTLEKTEWLSLGFLNLGMTKGDHGAILGENSSQWIFADLAFQCLGGISVGIYPTNSPDQVKYILDHSRSRFVVVSDQEQADKILEVKDQLPFLEKMIVISMKGLRHYNDSLIMSYSEVEHLGRTSREASPNRFSDLVKMTEPEDIAFIVYTSGTTGPPKGAMISHRNVIHEVIHCLQPVLNFSGDDSLLSYLPLCHIFERNLSVALPLVHGFTINFAESIETVQQNIQEISPTFFAAVPRILEKLYSGVNIKLDDTTYFKRSMFRLVRPVGRMAAHYKMKKQHMPLWLLICYGFAYLWSFRPIREKIGLLRCRCLMSGGAPIAPEVS